MPVVIPISSADDLRVEDYRAIRVRQRRTPEGRSPVDLDNSGEFNNGTFLAEGELVVRLLVRSQFRTRSVFLTNTRYESLRPVLDLLPGGTPIYVADQSVMSGVVGFDIHRGVLAAGDRGNLFTLDRLLESRPAGLVLLEDLANADNVGATFRNTAALAPGFAVVLSPACCDPLYRKAIRVSVGHVLYVPFALCSDWREGMERIRRAGYTLIALSPEKGSAEIGSVEPPRRPAILVGTEGAGISELAKGMADVRVRVPMSPGVDSLNVSVATAIALHRFGRA